MPALNKQQWDEIQELVEGGLSYTELSKQYGVSRQAISERAKRQGWVPGSASAEVDRLTSERLAGVAGLTDATQRKGAMVRVADERASLIEKHREEWVRLEVLEQEIWRCMNDKDYLPTFWDTTPMPGDETKLEDPFDHQARKAHLRHLQQSYKSMAEAFMTKQEGQRRSHGFDYKIQQESGGKDDAALREREHLTQSILSLAEVVLGKSADAPSDKDPVDSPVDSPVDTTRKTDGVQFSG